MDYYKDMEQFRNIHKIQEKQIGKATFRYFLSGKGENTFVLLPGGMGSCEPFYKHILAFEPYAQVLTFDYPLELNDNNSLADGIIALANSLELHNLIFIGQSYGGMLAQTIAKRHPNKIKGLVLSNTGTSTDRVIHTDIPLREMMERQKIALQQFEAIPYEKIKEMMMVQLRKYLPAISEEYRIYMEQIFASMVDSLSKERNVLMTGLLIDFVESQRFTKTDFETLSNKVLLILSEDDHTFSDSVKQELISILPNPTINRGLSGGHLSMILKIDDYVEAVLAFTSKPA